MSNISRRKAGDTMETLKKYIHGAAVCFGTMLSIVLVCFIGIITVLVECILRLCNWVFERSEKRRSRKTDCLVDHELK